MTSPARIVPFERPVPHDLEAEEAVIAALLVDPQAFDRMLPVCSPGDFYREPHGWIYDAARAVRERDEQVNQITVAHELAIRGQLEDIGGQSFLGGLVRRLPTSMGAEWYAAIVARQAKRRKLISLSATLSSMAHESDDPERVAELMVSQLISAGVNKARPFAETVAEILTVGGVADGLVSLMTEADRAQPMGFSTGYADLDGAIDGLVRGNFIPLLGDTGVGKSFFLANLARNLAKAGAKTLIVSTEVTAAELVGRNVWMEAGINAWARRFHDGFSETDIGRAMTAIGEVGQWGRNVWIANQPGIHLDALKANVRAMKMRHGFDVLMLDHLGHIVVRGMDETRTLSTVAKACKELAVMEDVPVLGVAHINRAAQEGGGRIAYNAAKNSGAVEQEADRVLSMYPVDAFGAPMERDDAARWRIQHGYQLVRIEVGKHRSGPTNSVTLELQWPLGGRFTSHGGAK